MTIRKIAFLMCVLSTLTLFSNSYTKQYEVFFPSGSSFVSSDILEQVVKIYNQIPELQFISVKCKGTEDKLATKAMFALLARERAKKVQKVFLQFGLKQKHVQLSFGTTPIVIVFKPKAILKSTSLITSQIDQHKEQYTIDAGKISTLISNENNLYAFAARSFETNDGTILKEGLIEVELTELCTNDQVVKCGVVGRQNGTLQEYGMYFNIEASHQGKELKLREGYVFKVIVSSELVPHTMTISNGAVVDRVMIWRNDRQGKIKEKFVTAEEASLQNQSNTTSSKLALKKGYKTELTLNHLGWSKCLKKLNVIAVNNRMLTLQHHDTYPIYLVASTSKIIIPAFENLNFKDLYQFENVPENISFQLVALSLDPNSKDYVYQSEINSTLKLLMPEINVCNTTTVNQCVHIK